MDGIGRALAANREQLLRARLHRLMCGLKLRGIHPNLRQLRGSKIIPQRVWNHEVAIGQSLHQRAGTQPVRAVIGKIRFAQHEKPGNGGHQVVVHPQPAHGVVNRGVDAHRHLVGVLIGDALVHLKQVAVTLANLCLAEPADGVRKVQINTLAARPDSAPFVAHLLRGTRGNIAWRKIAEAWVLALEIVVALIFWNLSRRTRVASLFRHPDAPIIAQGFRHQGQLALVIAGNRNARGVNLRIAGIAEGRAFLIGTPDRGSVGTLRVGRQIVELAIAARRQNHSIGGEGVDLAIDQIARDDAARTTIHQHEFQHFVPGVQRHLPQTDLPHQRLICAEQQLLPSLPASVESARNLRAAERAIGQRAAVFTGEGHALSDALVNDVHADFRETVDIGLARAKVSALYRVVEKPVDAIAIVLVVLRGVDATLRRNRVRPPRAILKAENANVVAQLRERCRGRRPGQTRPHHNHGILPLIGRIHQLHFKLMPRPFFCDRTRRHIGLQFHEFPSRTGVHACPDFGFSLATVHTRLDRRGRLPYFSQPITTESGTIAKPPHTTTVNTVASFRPTDS